MSNHLDIEARAISSESAKIEFFDKESGALLYDLDSDSSIEVQIDVNPTALSRNSLEQSIAKDEYRKQQIENTPSKIRAFHGATIGGLLSGTFFAISHIGYNANAGWYVALTAALATEISRTTYILTHQDPLERVKKSLAVKQSVLVDLNEADSGIDSTDYTYPIDDENMGHIWRPTESETVKYEFTTRGLVEWTSRFNSAISFLSFLDGAGFNHNEWAIYYDGVRYNANQDLTFLQSAYLLNVDNQVNSKNPPKEVTVVNKVDGQRFNWTAGEGETLAKIYWQGEYDVEDELNQLIFNSSSPAVSLLLSKLFMEYNLDRSRNRGETKNDLFNQFQALLLRRFIQLRYLGSQV